MGHSYSNVLVHIVFHTKNRRKIIPADRQEELWRYMTGIAKNLNINVLAIGGMADHIHILIALPGTIGFSTAIQKIKASSSKWISQNVRDFAWQEGFGAFSVSDSRRDDVIAYIHNQEEHHKKGNFEEEFIALLEGAQRRLRSKIRFWLGVVPPPPQQPQHRRLPGTPAPGLGLYTQRDPARPVTPVVLGFHISCLRHWEYEQYREPRAVEGSCG